MKSPKIKTVAIDWLELNGVSPMVGGNGSSPKLEHLGGSVPFRFSQWCKNERRILNYETAPAENIRTRVFSAADYIFRDGQKIATIFHTPYSPLIKEANEFSIKMENPILYGDWSRDVRNIFDAFKFEYRNLKRVDLAADGFGVLEPMRLLKLEKIAQVGRSMVNFTVNGGEGVSSFLVGSRRSDRYCRAYNKNKEIDQSSKKYYIREYWQSNGIDQADFENVERLELVLKGKAFAGLFPGVTTLEDVFTVLTDPDFIQSAMDAGLKNLYEFRTKVDSGKNVTRDAKRIFAVKWFARSLYPLQLLYRHSTERIRSIQTTIKTAYQLFLKTKRPFYWGMASELIHNSKMSVWFAKRRERFDYDFERGMAKSGDFLPLFRDNGFQWTIESLHVPAMK